MTISHLRFKQGSGTSRQSEIQTLIKYGVVSIVQAFEPDAHPLRSSTYKIKMREGVSYDVLNEYFEGNDNVIPITDEEVASLIDAPIIKLDRKGKPITE